MRLDSHNFSPALVGKIVRAAARHTSFAAAAASLNDEAEIIISGRQVDRLADEVGERLPHQRDRHVAAFREKSATPEVSVAPRLAAVFVDGGRLQTRSEEPGRGAGVHDPAWREDKVANLLTMHTEAHEQDPTSVRHKICAIALPGKVTAILAETSHVRAIRQPDPRT